MTPRVMRFHVYQMQNIEDKSALHTETDSFPVAELAVRMAAESIGPGLYAVLLSEGRPHTVIPGQWGMKKAQDS